MRKPVSTMSHPMTASVFGNSTERVASILSFGLTGEWMVVADQ